MENKMDIGSFAMDENVVRIIYQRRPNVVAVVDFEPGMDADNIKIICEKWLKRKGL